ncbi:uncharacterized protein [Onthophagus taurus]|uniref:uncharacterized protein n=1 Tax=Onthophagus taurus TaxID=166361 RepID=UPI0039BDF22C
MYAAAGGASLASRQARQRQRQNKKAQLQKASQKATELIPKPPQAKQFHNYTDQNVPKLSRVERNALKPPQAAPHERRHSTSNYHLKEPSRARIRESPSICIPVVPNHHHHHQNQKDSVQPLSPCTLVQQNHVPVPHSPSVQSQLPQITIPEGGDKSSLERRCSFVRQVEEMEKVTTEGGGGGNVLDRCNHICNFEIKEKAWENNVGTTYYTEYDKSTFGSWDYPFSECSQGRAAWQERERRRCSLSGNAKQHRLKQSEAHHRWMKRNRIHDTGFGGSSDEEDIFNVYQQSAAANALLYVGLGTMAIGSVIFFVGTGDKGFKTVELRLIGPTLMACGLLCCVIRVLLCTCPSTCLRRRKKTRKKDACATHGMLNNRNPKKRDRRKDFVPVEQASLMRQKSNHKKVSIAAGTSHAVPSTSTMNEPIIYVEDEIITHATQKPPEIPLISIPDLAEFNCVTHRPPSPDNSFIELQNFEATFEIESVSSGSESDDNNIINNRHSEKNTKNVIQVQEEQFSIVHQPTQTNNKNRFNNSDECDETSCLVVDLVTTTMNSGAIVNESAVDGERRNDEIINNKGVRQNNNQLNKGVSEILLSPLQLDGGKK